MEHISLSKLLSKRACPVLLVDVEHVPDYAVVDVVSRAHKLQTHSILNDGMCHIASRLLTLALASPITDVLICRFCRLPRCC